MNQKGHSSGNEKPSRRRSLWALAPALLAVLVTGCPHNDYTVEMKPSGGGVERTVTFYCADGVNSNGVPNYQSFPSNELASITAVYPSNAVTQDGQRYIARGEFAGTLPHDIGGAGSFTNWTTTLGSAGVYLERFRGNDDLAAKTGKQFHAADQLTDLVIGWAQTEFGHEQGYEKLHQFLDKDFREDLKNVGMYFWVGQLTSLSDTNAVTETSVRFVQYLLERGYVKLSDATNLTLLRMDSASDQEMLHLLRRTVAEKIGISGSEPLPKSFDVLRDPDLLEKSWTNYLAQTDLYRAQVKDWETKKKAKPDLKEPDPSDAANGLISDLFDGFDPLGGSTDHLTVKLALHRPPTHSNGEWQNGQEVWSCDLDPNRPLPFLCYATWSDPDASFQTNHFGKVILDGDSLSEYCLWRTGLGEQQAGEWDAFLSGLNPGEDLKKKLEAFRFATETISAGATNQPNAGPQILIESLPNDAAPGSSVQKQAD